MKVEDSLDKGIAEPIATKQHNAPISPPSLAFLGQYIRFES